MEKTATMADQFRWGVRKTANIRRWWTPSEGPRIYEEVCPSQTNLNSAENAIRGWRQRTIQAKALRAIGGMIDCVEGDDIRYGGSKKIDLVSRVYSLIQNDLKNLSGSNEDRNRFISEFFKTSYGSEYYTACRELGHDKVEESKGYVRAFLSKRGVDKTNLTPRSTEVKIAAEEAGSLPADQAKGSQSSQARQPPEAHNQAAFQGNMTNSLLPGSNKGRLIQAQGFPLQKHVALSDCQASGIHNPSMAASSVIEYSGSLASGQNNTDPIDIFQNTSGSGISRCLTAPAMPIDREATASISKVVPPRSSTWAAGEQAQQSTVPQPEPLLLQPSRPRPEDLLRDGVRMVLQLVGLAFLVGIAWKRILEWTS